MDSIWVNLATGARCYYDNDSLTYAPDYGPRYNFYSVTDPRGLCPAGWHVPTEEEFSILIGYVGSDPVGKLKEYGTLHWNSPNTGFLFFRGNSAMNREVLLTQAIRWIIVLNRDIFHVGKALFILKDP